MKRSERISKQKLARRFETWKKMHKGFGKSVAVFGSTMLVGISQFTAKEVSALTETQTQFMKKIVPAAKKVSAGKNLYTSVMIAQAVLETGWGQSTLSQEPNNNLFGVKGNYKGQSVVMNTLEDSGGMNYYTIQDSFRKYPSYVESLEDYANLLLNGLSWNRNFYAGTWKSNTTSYRDATAYLTGRYATDSGYASKLNYLIETYNLTQYDVEQAVEASEGSVEKTVQKLEEKVEKEHKVDVVTPTGSYVVQAGDSFWGIAHKHGISLETLLSLNNKSVNDVIHPGQRLVVNGSTSTVSIPKAEKPTPTTPATPTTATSTAGSYVVQAGDSFWGIAHKHGISLETLLSLNNKSVNDVIHPGQRLVVSGSTSTVSAPKAEKPTSTPTTPATPTPATSTAGSYVVKAGDSLWLIAHNNGISLTTLLSLNNLTVTSTIHPGQTLIVSGSSNAAPVATTYKESTSSVSTTSGNYTVQAGDSFWTIANKHGISLETLLSLNNKSINDVIHPGHQLVVSGNAQKVATPVAANTATASSTSTYTIEAGDSFWAISQKTGVSMDTLLAVNGMQLTSLIHPGQVLKLK